ncbi:MAG: CRTAC1 family protein [Acidobacteria bacterium]|nr:CRTAC1 family protein [Acidobacteriota bacterium]
MRLPDMKRIAALSSLLFLVTSVMPGQLVFEDVSKEAGLDGFSYFSQTAHGLGVNWIDFDNDYNADLFLVNGGGAFLPHLYRNRGDGTFELVDQLLPLLPTNVDLSASVFGDYDNDGDSDIYIFVDNRAFSGALRLNFQDGPANILLKNLWMENGGRVKQGEPLFEEIAEAAGVQDLADTPLGPTWPGHRAKTGGWLDYDRDGCIDLFVGHLVFGPVGYGLPSTRNRLYRNRCDGTFEDVTASSGVDDGTDPFRFRPTLAFIGAHLDGDLWPDMYVVNTSHSSPTFERDVLFLNNGDGTFRDATGDSPGFGNDTEAGMGIDVADIDLDGDWDVYISDLLNTRLDQFPRGNALYLGNGDGTFQDNIAVEAGVTGTSSWGVTFFDAEQDGYEDLFVATMRISPTPYVYRNMGDTTFADLTDSSATVTPDGRGTAVADYDADGDLDLAVVNDNGALTLYRNQAPQQGSSLRVRLRATQSNRSAIGAVVKVKAGGLNMMRQIKGGSSAHSQDELVAHFGVAFEKIIDEVRVLWPSGVEDEVYAVEPDRTITIAEGTTAASTPYLHAYPPYVDMGAMSLDGESERSVAVINEGAGTLLVTQVACD